MNDTIFHFCRNLWMSVYDGRPFMANINSQLRRRPGCRSCRVVTIHSLDAVSMRACVTWPPAIGRERLPPDWSATAAVDRDRPHDGEVYRATFDYEPGPSGPRIFGRIDRPFPQPDALR